MRGARFLLPILAALAVASCARQQQAYVIDPATGRPVPVQQPYASQYAQPQYAQEAYQQPQYAQQTYQQPVAQPAPSGGHGLFASQIFARPQYAQQPQYAQDSYQQPVGQAAPESSRGLFKPRPNAPPPYMQQPAQQAYVQQPVQQTYVQQPAPQVYLSRPVQQPYVLQYTPPQSAAPQYAPPPYAGPHYAAPYRGGPYVAAPYGYAAASPYEQPYTLDAGNKLRVVVFGQDGISNSYIVDAGGNVNLPLVGVVPARGATTLQLSRMIAERLKQGYVREPHVSVEVEAYRPFFILGEVTNPGQYPYVADVTVEKAIAIAGGFSPRASKRNVELTRSAPGQSFKGSVPLAYPLRPGDTVVVKERWF
jgi:Polysaccharide biosynthesis/export protein/SLBB domain